MESSIFRLEDILNSRSLTAMEVQIMETKWILKYLTDLNVHNNRGWYNAHLAETKAATEKFEELVQEIILRIGEFDRSILHIQPKDTIFRLIRYPRFGSDRTPYNPAFRAHISAKGQMPVPVGYYLMIKPGGQSYLGGGLFASSFRDATERVRGYITEFGEEFDEIIHAPEFEKYFRVQGTSLLNVPSGYDKEHPQAEWLKFKNWYLEYPIADETVADAEILVAEAAKGEKISTKHSMNIVQSFLFSVSHSYPPYILCDLGGILNDQKDYGPCCRAGARNNKRSGLCGE